MPHKARCRHQQADRTDESPLLQDIGLYEFFDLIVCGDTASKPNQIQLRSIYVQSTSTLAPEQVLMVGDSETDVLAAQAASVDVACMRDGYNHGVDVATLKADFILETFADLPGL